MYKNTNYQQKNTCILQVSRVKAVNFPWSMQSWKKCWNCFVYTICHHFSPVQCWEMSPLSLPKYYNIEWWGGGKIDHFYRCVFSIKTQNISMVMKQCAWYITEKYAQAFQEHFSMIAVTTINGCQHWYIKCITSQLGHCCITHHNS